MNSFASLSALAAVIAGLTSSLHCFAMCGPLACASCSRPAQPNEASSSKLKVIQPKPLNVMGSYHVARVLAYTLFGGLFGLLGERAMDVFTIATPAWLPWALVVLLVASALGLGEWMPKVPGVSALLRKATRASARLTPTLRAGAMGAITPLLPCGLLYGLFAGALVTGSFARGAILAAGFAVGGIPALTLAQFQTSWLRKLPRGSEFIIRRIVPLAAAVAIAIRAWNTDGCPLCP